MTRRVNQVLWEEWRQRIERQRESGLPIVAFCRKEGVSAVTFHTWKRKLLGQAMDRSAADAVSARRRRQPSRGPAAATARGGNFLQLPVLGARSGLWIELTLVDGTIVRIPQQNLAALQTVLAMLRAGEPTVLHGEVAHA
jgi:hypothetical protein